MQFIDSRPRVYGGLVGQAVGGFSSPGKKLSKMRTKLEAKNMTWQNERAS
jgi:hypothetical protein